jgi:hypothetical protein
MAAKKAAKKAKKAAKAPKAPQRVKLTMPRETVEALVDATAALGAPGICVEKFVDDPKVASEMKKRAKSKTPQ